MKRFKDGEKKNGLKFSNEDLTEFELESIKEEVRRKVRVENKKSLRKIAVVMIGIVLIGGGITPVIAENVPFIKEIYNKFGMIKEFKDYTEYVGMREEFDGGTVTLDNLIITRDKVMVLVEVKTDEKISSLDKFMITGKFGEKEERKSMGTFVSEHKVDDNTVIIEAILDFNGNKLKKNEELIFSIVNEKNKSLVEFDIKADISNTLDKVYDFEVNKKVNDEYKLKNIESTVLDTTLIFEYKDNIIKNGEYTKFDEPSDNILSVDGRLYFMNRSEPDVEKNSYSVTYNGVNKELLENANSIELITSNGLVEDKKDLELKKEYVTKNNVKYPKVIKLSTGEIIKLDDVKNDESEVTLNIESEGIEELAVARSLNKIGEFEDESKVVFNSFFHHENIIQKIDNGYSITFRKHLGNEVNYNIDIEETDIGIEYERITIK